MVTDDGINPRVVGEVVRVRDIHEHKAPIVPAGCAGRAIRRWAYNYDPGPFDGLTSRHLNIRNEVIGLGDESTVLEEIAEIRHSNQGKNRHDGKGYHEFNQGNSRDTDEWPF